MSKKKQYKSKELEKLIHVINLEYTTYHNDRYIKVFSNPIKCAQLFLTLLTLTQGKILVFRLLFLFQCTCE